MKKTFTILLLIQLFAALSLYSQNTATVAEEESEPVTVSKPIGIDGTHLLQNDDIKTAEFLKANPDYYKKTKLNKTSGWNFSVGSQKSWYTVDFAGGPRYQTATTCRAVGNNCYIFVEDSLWGNRVTQKVVDSVRVSFDKGTPANANKGIYQTNTETFGDPPDYDNDSKIVIVILNIKDSYTTTGVYIQGFFSSTNEVAGSTSNLAEIFFLDANPLDMRTAAGLIDGMSVLAHEFQHMLHWNYHQISGQLTFVNEGCSLVSEVICGYSIYDQGKYVAETNYPLIGWRSTSNSEVLRDYSRAARFNQYLNDQFGPSIFKHIVSSQYYGLDVYKDALSKIGSSLTMNKLLTNWFIANILDDKTVDPAYGYTYPNLPKTYGKTFYNPNASVSGTLSEMSAEYITIKAGENLSAQFSTTSSILIGKAILIGASEKKVIDLNLNGTFSEPDFGTKYNMVTFAIINPEYMYGSKYTAKITGVSKAIELKWDNSPVAGRLIRAPGDTVCVQFDAIEGGKLDSVKIAVWRPGVLQGKICLYNSTTKLGSILKEFSLTSTEQKYTPYADPYDNYLKVDLSKDNITTDKAFAIGVGVPGDTSTYPHVMVSKLTGTTSSYHSFTYLKSGNRWTYYQVSNQTAIWLYMMRAYVSFPDGTTKVLEPEVIAKTMSLEQNYPNPFNPETKIKFSLPESGITKITVYDIMGREVKTLLNDFITAGEHEINFNAKNIASGIYYYKLECNNTVNMKKMVLMK